MKRKFIVITSIFHPTEAISSYAQIKDCTLIVVGDQKTPNNWYHKNVQYLSLEEQKQCNFRLSQILPNNHYSRKMIGYLKAIEYGADCIIDTDDDNIPKEFWTFPSFEVNVDYISDNMGFINIYQLFSDQKIWPRGLPLNLINTTFNFNKKISQKRCKIGIWQGLADEDPDVDAIYRLTDNTVCFFKEKEPVVLGKGTISPFNTQNTAIRKELFPLLYLPIYVTFRFTDILRGLVAQPIMWLYDYHLGFTNATVVQKRNPHDFMKDFISEIPMYINSEKIISIVSKSISKTNSIEDNLVNSYEALLKEDIIIDDELTALKAWVYDIKKLKIT